VTIFSTQYHQKRGGFSPEAKSLRNVGEISWRFRRVYFLMLTRRRNRRIAALRNCFINDVSIEKTPPKTTSYFAHVPKLAKPAPNEFHDFFCQKKHEFQQLDTTFSRRCAGKSRQRREGTCAFGAINKIWTQGRKDAKN